jgi:hypothetical protein
MIFFLLTFTGLFKKGRNFILIALLFFCFYCLGIISPFYDCLFYFFAGCLLAQFFNKIHFGWLTVILSFAFLLIMAKYQLPELRNNFYFIRILDLMIKTERGTLETYYMNNLKGKVTVVDGSVACDLPMNRMSELFNINTFIVS